MRFQATSALLFCATLAACDGGDGVPAVDPDTVTPDSVRAHVDTLPPAPVQDPDAVELGRLLFWDPILSAERDVACASCHHPDFDYSDGLFASLGVGATGLGDARSGGMRTPRNSQSVVNTVYNGLTRDGAVAAADADAPMFWDSRVHSLEAQARQPLISELEMRGTTISEADILPELLRRLGEIAEYQTRFDAVYEDGITEDNLLAAIAAFERTLVARNSPFDRFMRGDRTAMSDEQIVGLQRFIDTGCAECHSGPMFSDFQLHVLGAPDHPQNPNGVDRGADGSPFAFRTPTLRNVIRTGPWLHGGTEDSLIAVMNFYEDLSEGDSNNSQVPNSALDPLATAGAEPNVASLIAFLEALDDPDIDRQIPRSVPSGLPVGGAQ